jgi:predicted AAA+ superfamily ATPase
MDNRELFFEKNYDNIIFSLTQRGLNFKEKTFIVLDEIQFAPASVSILKYLYDHYDIKFIVTGSSSYYLKNLFSESLSGRKKIFEISTLDFSEFLTFKNIEYRSNNFFEQSFNKSEYERLKLYYDQYVEFGGFPEVVLSNDISEKKDIIQDIISSYINIDIAALSDFRNPKNLYNLLKLLAVRTGSRIDISKLSSLSKLSRATVQNYIDFFENTYIIKTISVISNSPDREIVKAKKIYFCDNGIVNSLADLSSGAKFENAVFSQLTHFGELNYFALKSGNEIDFIFEKKLALEIKESPTETDLKNLVRISQKAKLNQFRLIGRNIIPNFTDYIWGGDIK